MKKLIVVILLGLMLVGCGRESKMQAAVRECSEAIADIGNIPNVEVKCDHLPQDKQREAAEIASKRNGLIVFVPPYEAKKVREMPDHNYAMQDGMQYGYQSLISEEDRKAGQVAAKLVMAYYAGEREGKYQAHIMDGTMVSAIECAKPCEFLKVMTYADADYLRDTIKVDRMAAAPGSIGMLIMQDAMNGKLKQYGREINGKRYSMWMNEHDGMKRVALK